MKRKPKTFAGIVVQNLTRKKQLEAMRKQLLKGARKGQNHKKVP